MGQKVNPNSLRFGLNRNWMSRWNARDGRLRAKWILEDEAIRRYLERRFKECGVGQIEIERFLREDQSLEVDIYLHLAQMGAFPSLEEGSSREIRRLLGRRNATVKLIPAELANPHVCANLIAQEIVDTIEARMPHRSTVKRLIKRAMGSGALGMKVKVSGRINGVEIARSECYADGSVPLSTLRADIDYSFRIAKTTYGIIGVKVYVNRGIYLGKRFMPLPPAPAKIQRAKETTKFVAHTY